MLGTHAGLLFPHHRSPHPSERPPLPRWCRLFIALTKTSFEEQLCDKGSLVHGGPVTHCVNALFSSSFPFLALSPQAGRGGRHGRRDVAAKGTARGLHFPACTAEDNKAFHSLSPFALHAGKCSLPICRLDYLRLPIGRPLYWTGATSSSGWRRGEAPAAVPTGQNERGGWGDLRENTRPLQTSRRAGL